MFEDNSPSKKRVSYSEEALLGQEQVCRHEDLQGPARGKGASMLTLVVNLITGSLGTGILSLPWGFAGSSIISGVILTVFTILINFWTIVIIIHAADRYQVFDLGSLLRCIPGRLGPTLQFLVDGSIWFIMFSLLVGYIMIMTDAAMFVTPLDAAPMLRKREFWVVCSSVAVFPLCFLKLTYLSFTSTLSIMVNLFLFLLAIWDFTKKGLANDVCMLGVTDGSVTYCSAMMVSVVIQMCVLPMYEEMERRSPARFTKALIISFIFVFLLVTMFAGVSYATYGSHVQSNILNSLPGNSLGRFARIGMIVVSMGVYPIMLKPMVAPLRVHPVDSVYPSPGGRYVPVTRKPCGPTKADVITGVIVASAMVVALFVDNLGFVNVINGAASIVTFVGLAPGFIGIYLLGQHPSLSWKMAMYALIVFSGIMTVVGMYFTDNNATVLLRNCLFFWD